jgi:hypothetical protein
VSDSPLLDKFVSLVGSHTPDEIAAMVEDGLRSGKLDLATCAEDHTAMGRMLDELEIQKAVREDVVDGPTFAAVVLTDAEAGAVSKLRHAERHPATGRFAPKPSHAVGDRSGNEATDSALEGAVRAEDNELSFFRPERVRDAGQGAGWPGSHTPASKWRHLGASLIQGRS